MNKKAGSVVIPLMLIILLGGLIYLNFNPSKVPIVVDTFNETINKVVGTNQTSYTQPSVATSSSLKIAAWNLQIFGDTKASNIELMNKYANKIDDYDIIFLQEIRDSDGSAFDALCQLLPGYNCVISSRAGRNVSKEQYGVVYKNKLNIETVDYNPDSLDRWERPPFLVRVNNLSIYVIHIKPDDVKQELIYLEQLVPKEDNTIVMGDFNMDCSYYNDEANPEFDTWTPTVVSAMDTTVGETDCAYDRVFYYKYTHVYDSNIDRSITPDMSDHYLISFTVDGDYT